MKELEELVLKEGISVIKEKLAKIELKLNSHLVKTIDAKLWFKNSLNELTVDIDDPFYLRYKKGDVIYLWYEDEHHRLFVNYKYLWLILESDYHLKYTEISKLCGDVVSKTLKLKVGITQLRTGER